MSSLLHHALQAAYLPIERLPCTFEDFCRGRYPLRQLHFLGRFEVCQMPCSTEQCRDDQYVAAGLRSSAARSIIALPRQQRPAAQTRRGQQREKLAVQCLRSGPISNYNKTAP